MISLEKTESSIAKKRNGHSNLLECPFIFNTQLGAPSSREMHVSCGVPFVFLALVAPARRSYLSVVVLEIDTALFKCAVTLAGGAVAVTIITKGLMFLVFGPLIILASPGFEGPRFRDAVKRAI